MGRNRALCFQIKQSLRRDVLTGSIIYKYCFSKTHLLHVTALQKTVKYRRCFALNDSGETRVNRRNLLAVWRIVVTKFNRDIVTQLLRLLWYR